MLIVEGKDKMRSMVERLTGYLDKEARGKYRKNKGYEIYEGKGNVEQKGQEVKGEEVRGNKRT